MILVLDTASENVFIGLWDETKSVWDSHESFLGGRELNLLIIKKLDKSFRYSQENQNKLVGIVVAAGPGSFTGLRIGMSVANTLAYTLDIPIVAPMETKTTEDLLQKGLDMLKSAGSQYVSPVVPHYGAEPHITKPKSH
jgi:tRNA threonylcarbamoyladenosine biosynthesis protein TsaB